MNKTILHIPGLNTPHWLLWIHGWCHGHLLKSGGMDPTTNTISSCYITGKSSLFYKACIARVEALERKLQMEWSEADELLVDYKGLCSALETQPSSSTTASDSIRARTSEHNAKTRAMQEAKYQAVLKRLTAIASHVRSEEHIAIDQMESTGEKLKSAFAAYGHGMLLKAVYPDNLPQLAYTGCFVDYRKAHKATIDALEKIISEIREGI